MESRDKAQTDDDIRVGDLFAAIKNGWKRVVKWSLVLGAITYGVLSIMTPKYSSQARVLVSDGTSYQKPARGQSVERGRQIDATTILSQIEVIKSRDIIGNVIDDLNLTKEKSLIKSPANSFMGKILSYVDPSMVSAGRSKKDRAIDTILSNLKVQSLAQSRVLGIEYISQNPELAAAIANGVAKSYIDWQRSGVVTQNKEDSIKLSKLIEDLRQKVTQSEQAVAAYRAKTGLAKSGRENLTLNQQQLSELNSQLIAARARRAEAEARADIILTQMKLEGSVANSPDVLRSGLIQRLFEQRVQVQRTMSELSATILPSHPRLRQLRAEMVSINVQLKQEMKKIALSLQNEAKIAKSRELSLMKSLDELKGQSAKTGDNEIKLAALEREATANRQLLETYLARLRDAEARKESQVAPTHASIVSLGHVASRPYFPKKIPITSLVIFASLILGFGLLILFAALKGSSRPDEDHNNHNNSMTDDNLLTTS